MEVMRPAMLVTDDSCIPWYSKIQLHDVPSLRWHVSLDSPSSDVLRASSNLLTTESIKKNSVGAALTLNYSWAPEGAVIICFTSGTSGRPKGVTLSHSPFIIQSLAKIAVVGYGEDDVYLHTAPLCYLGGLSSALAMLMVGACHVLMPKFEVKSALESIERHSVTSLITVPAMMADLVSRFREKETWKGRDSLTKAAIKLFPQAKLLSAYGNKLSLSQQIPSIEFDWITRMTETCSSLTFMTLYEPTADTASQPLRMVQQGRGVCVGKPAPHVELKISVDGSSRVGRILTRGQHVMLRYWHGSPPNASVSGDEVWFDTGDIGSIDDSDNVWLIRRANGRIKSGGENIYPEEVERTLLQHPGVTGVVVVGIPDSRLTEMVVACVQIREDWQWMNTTIKHSVSKQMPHISSEILCQYCKQKNLTGFKIPKIFILWKKPFPATTTGKIRRDQVRGEAVFHLQHLNSNL
ncbi:2-succinylbenzoate--CoA ligase [Pyrus ussuriensis x Pyrus communis]|uniref:2-succinylbenzoate--CoA ligase n=1 Tax=Pyrus ussuriensis x Pyrus communis TaxID=2448454 RepID=A0A5N5IBI3_9ROSA|nr:2-succinylbenzoate--CoA ligase [Pyrus ussuriensis x Pyrus communis]